MSFAAEAVMDLVAPSPARLLARAPSDAGPSFEEHLAATAPPEASAGPPRGGLTPESGAGTAETKENTDGKPTETPEVLVAAAPLPLPPQTTPLSPVVMSPAPTISVQAPDAAPAAPAPAAVPAPPAQQANFTAAAAPASTQPMSQPVTANADSAPAIAQAPGVERAPPTQNGPITAAQTQPYPAASPPNAPAPAQGAATPAVQAPQGPQITPQAAVAAAPVTMTPQNTLGSAARPIAPPTPHAQHAKAAPEPLKFAPAAANAKAATAPAKNATGVNIIAGSKPDLSTLVLSAPGVEADIQAASAALPGAAHAHQASAAEHSLARAAPIAATQVSREIIRRFDGGNTRFEMRLDPPELGRIEVRLEVTRDHRVSAMIAADSPAALSDLVRHARELEQSLQAAGLELSEQGLTFDLRQDGEDAGKASGEAGGATGADANDNEHAGVAPQTARLERWRGARIDVMA